MGRQPNRVAVRRLALDQGTIADGGGGPIHEELKEALPVLARIFAIRVPLARVDHDPWERVDLGRLEHVLSRRTVPTQAPGTKSRVRVVILGVRAQLDL